MPFPAMSVYGNVVAGIRLGRRRRPSRADLDAILERVLTETTLWPELSDRLDAPGIACPAGQQQRLCIARALAVQPDVLLMDDPCSALDPISTFAVEDPHRDLRLWQRICARGGLEVAV